MEKENPFHRRERQRSRQGFAPCFDQTQALKINEKMQRILYTLSLVVCINFSVFAQTERINITFFGSSVCRGAGAENNHGYAWQFYHSGAIDTVKFNYLNASTGGDNTIKVEREERLTKKLFPTNPNIVVIGLSLGNEGIRKGKSDNEREQILEQYRSRLLALVDQCR